MKRSGKYKVRHIARMEHGSSSVVLLLKHAEQNVRWVCDEVQEVQMETLMEEETLSQTSFFQLVV